MFRSGDPPRPPAPRRGPRPTAAARLAVPALTLLLCASGASALRAQVASRVRVEVREAGSERPLPGVDVRTASGAAALTGADGRALLRGLPAGAHVLRAQRVGYAPAEARVEVENGRTADVVLRLVPRPVELDALGVEVPRLPDGARAVRPSELPAGARTVADAVETVPGVTVVRRGGPDAAAVPRIRGSSGDQVLVLVDGAALNSPLTGEADLSRIDAGSVERVVVIPGSRAARYGAGALAGVILVETRGAGRTGWAVAAEAGSLGRRGVEARGTLGGPGTPWAVSGRAAWSDAGGAFEYAVPEVRGGGTARRHNAGSRSATASAEAAWTPAAGPGIRLRLHGRDSERGSPGTVVQPSLTGRHQERLVGAVLLGEGGSPGRGWRGSLAADGHRGVFADPDPPFAPAYRSEVRVRQVEARAEAWTLAGPVELSGGADGRLRRIRADGLAASAPRDLSGGGAWLRGRWRQGALEVVPTLRVDAHDLLDGVAASPSLTARLSTSAAVVEATAGRSVAPPDLSDLFFQEGVLAEANPELAPERVRGELDLRVSRAFGTPGGVGASVEAAAFVADVDGMILWAPDHRFVWSPRNVDVSRRGLEASAEARTGALGRLRARASWTEVEYDAPVLDGQVVYRPRFSAGVDAAVRLGEAGLGAAWSWTGSRRTSPGSDLNELPGHGRLDASATVPFRLGGAAGAVELSLRNVLDERAALLVDYPLPGRTLSFRVRIGSARP